MSKNQQHPRSASRRNMLIGGTGAVIAAAASTAIAPNAARQRHKTLNVTMKIRFIQFLYSNLSCKLLFFRNE